MHFEDEAVAPSSIYGEMKALSEAGVVKWGGCVVRISWVFGPEKKAFVDAVMEKALAGESLAAVADKTSLPCYTVDLVEWVAGLIDLGCPNGVVNACQGGDPVSWHGMAEEVLNTLVEKGALKERPVVARQLLQEMGGFRAVRPRHTALGTAKLAGLLGRAPRNWKEALREYLIQSLISR